MRYRQCIESKETNLKGVLSGSNMALCRSMAGPPPALRSVG